MNYHPIPTPQQVLDAMYTVQEYLTRSGYSSVLIVPGGGASFSRGGTPLDKLIAYSKEWLAMDALRSALLLVTTQEPIYAYEGALPGNQWGPRTCYVLCGAEQIPASAAPFPHDPACPWIVARAAVGAVP